MFRICQKFLSMLDFRVYKMAIRDQNLQAKHPLAYEIIMYARKLLVMLLLHWMLWNDIELWEQAIYLSERINLYETQCWVLTESSLHEGYQYVIFHLSVLCSVHHTIPRMTDIGIHL